MTSDLLYEGDHLLFLRRRGWEYAEHKTAKESVMVVAVTSDLRIVLTEEFRPAVNAAVICLPAGLVGDEGPEDTESAARRELLEETGWRAAALVPIGRGPGSPGMSSEIVNFYAAPGVVLEGAQGEHEAATIRVHVVAIDAIGEWALDREREGAWIDPKVWSGLELARRAGALQ